MFKYSSDCLQIFLFELGIYCDLGPYWELLVSSGARESLVPSEEQNR